MKDITLKLFSLPVSKIFFIFFILFINFNLLSEDSKNMDNSTDSPVELIFGIGSYVKLDKINVSFSSYYFNMQNSIHFYYIHNVNKYAGFGFSNIFGNDLSLSLTRTSYSTDIINYFRFITASGKDNINDSLLYESGIICIFSFSYNGFYHIYDIHGGPVYFIGYKHKINNRNVLIIGGSMCWIWTYSKIIYTHYLYYPFYDTINYSLSKFMIGVEFKWLFYLRKKNNEKSEI